ncbi:ABC transporter permease [Mycobacterium sp. 236(2023)]|uniref:ABC transporter permease n=1 Tax=Mycobacterium sp. 236(2023) TaxID=3038163 RepID=UPI002415618E|nr:ABC transporter permease [Mycobacterium sp. 236(2023)]MDG4667631.1 ABC transporter permease [Mycobacterium sp. 236(2023)]
MSENWLRTAPLTPYDQPYASQRPAFTWLLQREIVRYMKVWYYTVAGQVLAALLFVFVFGLALGSRIAPVGGVPYDQFILPGLVVLAVVTAGYIQGSASLFEARKDRFINAVLASPLRWWEINLALVLGSIVRGILISAAILLIAMPLTGSHIARPGYAFVAFAAVLIFAAQAGMIAGMYNQTQEHVAAIQVLIVQPLCFLGGVFYSVHDLAPAWRALSYLNPVFYAVQAMRNGMLGHADISAPLALVVVIGAAAVVGAFLAHKFRTGDRLKP